MVRRRLRIWLDVGVGYTRAWHDDIPPGYRFRADWAKAFVDVTDVPAHTIKAGPPLNVWVEEIDE